MNDNNDNLATIVKTSQRNYKVLVGYKSIEALGNELESLNVNGKIFLKKQLFNQVCIGLFWLL